VKQNCGNITGANPQIERIKWVYVITAFAAFVGGVAIYAFFRNIDNLVVFHFFPKPLFLGSLSAPVRPGTLPGYLFVYNLPHGLWCLSGLMVIRVIWLTNIKWRAIYGGLFLVVISALEISQLSENRNGTFDVLDLISYGFFAFVESLAYNTFIKRSIV